MINQTKKRKRSNKNQNIEMKGMMFALLSILSEHEQYRSEELLKENLKNKKDSLDTKIV